MTNSKKGNRTNHPRMSRNPYKQDNILFNSVVFKVLVFYISGEDIAYKDIDSETKKKLNKTYSQNNFSKIRKQLTDMKILEDITSKAYGGMGAPKKRFKLNYIKLLELFLTPLFGQQSTIEKKFKSKTFFIDKLKIDNYLENPDIREILIIVLKKFMISIQKIIYNDIIRDIDKIENKNNSPFLGYEDYLKDYWNLYKFYHNQDILLIDSSKINLSFIINLFYEFYLSKLCDNIISEKIEEKFPPENGKEVWDEECGYPVYEYPDREVAEWQLVLLKQKINFYFITDLNKVLINGIDYILTGKQHINYSL